MEKFGEGGCNEEGDDSKKSISIKDTIVGRIKRSVVGSFDIIESIAKSDDPAKSVEALRMFYKENRSDINAIGVIKALEKIGTPDAVEAIREFCEEDRYPSACVSGAIATLGRISSPEAVTALKILLSDKRKRHDAIKALGEIGTPDAVEVLKEACFYTNKNDAECAIIALGKTHCSEAVGVLKEVLHDKDLQPDVIKALTENDTPEATNALTEFYATSK